MRLLALLEPSYLVRKAVEGLVGPTVAWLGAVGFSQQGQALTALASLPPLATCQFQMPYGGERCPPPRGAAG